MSDTLNNVLFNDARGAGRAACTTPLASPYDDQGETAPREECGVFGVWAPGEDVAKLTYYGLYALQHRGQEAAGIGVGDGGNILVIKDLGLVSQAFDEQSLSTLKGHVAIGHTRYSTAGGVRWEHAQPMFRTSRSGDDIALGHNGNLINQGELRAEAAELGLVDPSTDPTDSDVMTALLAYYHDGTKSLVDNARELLPRFRGAFCLTFTDGDRLYAARDPHGIRPLCLGRLERGWVVASETCALDIVGASFVREIDPGEMVVIDGAGVQSTRFALAPLPRQAAGETDQQTAASAETGRAEVQTAGPAEDAAAVSADASSEASSGAAASTTAASSTDAPTAAASSTASSRTDATTPRASHKGCVFEYVYLARPDSVIRGQAVNDTRVNIGRTLAREWPADADLVIPVPSSGTPAAVGYAQGSGIPFGEGLTKNAYVGRTFIQPSQTIRQLGIRLKLNPLKSVIAGKRLVVVDDSIVRGNTQRALIRMLREAGAAEVHVRIASPPVKWPCFYGIDFASPGELIANGVDQDKLVEGVCTAIGADTLGYVSIEGMVEASGQPRSELCCACFDGNYPLGLPDIGANAELVRKLQAKSQ